MEKTSAATPRNTMQGHTDRVRGVAHLHGGVIFLPGPPGKSAREPLLWPEGQRVIRGSLDGSLRLWDLERGMRIGDEWDNQGDKSGVLTMALSPNSKTVVSGSVTGTVRLWELETRKVIGKWAGHTAAVNSMCWSPDGERVVSGSGDGTARVWDVKGGKLVQGLNPIKTGHREVYAVSYSPSAMKIATGGWMEDAIKILELGMDVG